MKNIRTLVMALMLSMGWLGTAAAQSTAGTVGAAAGKEPPEPLTYWTFVQIGFLPTVPRGTQNSNVYGLKLGAPMVDGKGRVYGVEPSLMYSGTNYVGGIQAAWVGACISRKVDGLQAAGGFCMCEEMNGLMPAIVNINKIMRGYQPGFVNITEELTGFQSGFVNIAKKKCTGFQLGFINLSKENGCQLGVLNFIEDGWLPVCPFFNVYF